MSQKIELKMQEQIESTVHDIESEIALCEKEIQSCRTGALL